MLFNKSNKDIDKFAQEHGYKGAKYIGKWKEYKVYEPYVDDTQVSYTGLPLVILVNDNGEIRMSTSDEAMATMNDESFMNSYESNQKEEQIIKALEDMNDSKMVNTQIEIYFKSLLETQTDVEDEYMSLPVINMVDKSNIKLQSVIISSYIQNDKKYYYCQGYIDKDYNIKNLPTCKLFENVDLINTEISMLSVIPKGEYPSSTIDELKEKYYSLLDIIKKLVIKDPNTITSDESSIILDYLKLYRYLEKEEVQAYQSLKSDFLIWCMGCSNAINNQDEIKIKNLNVNNTSLCPICNSELVFIMPAGSPLYCKNCDKYFENNDGKAGKPVEKPTYNKDVFY